MAGETTQVVMDEDETMQPDPIYLSSNEDTASQYTMSDQYLTKDDNTQNETWNQFLVCPNELSDAVTISTYDTDPTEPSLSMTTNSWSQLTKHLHNVYEATTSYFSQTGPHFTEIRRQK